MNVSTTVHHIYATVMIKNGLWRVIFERNSNGVHTVAQHIFGSEPSDAEVYQFIINNYYLLKFSEPQNFEIIIKRQNPKRTLREVKKLLTDINKNNKPLTYAEEVMKQQLELNKNERKIITKQQKQEMAVKKIAIRQEKRKNKHKGR